MLQSKNIQDKIRKTTLEKYGYAHHLQSPEIIQKRKNTCLELYGDENYNNREKAIQTCQDKYGVDYNLQRNELRELLLSDKVKEKRKKSYIETMQNTYGVTCGFKT